MEIIFCIVGIYIYIFIHISIHRSIFLYNFYAIATCFQKKLVQHANPPVYTSILL